jgi:MFS family permease
MFHGDVTLRLKLHASVRQKIGASGRACIKDSGERTNMSTLAATEIRTGGMTKDERFVILASSLGTVFEWYDFYLFGSLASIIGAQFFGVIDPVTKAPMFNQAARDIFALLAFAAGFIVRPFGAIVFGRVGDIVGRKYTFLVTILIMGMSTFVVGLLPGAAQIGIAAPIILISLRLLQGLALGGEYGGAATYVAEHGPVKPLSPDFPASIGAAGAFRSLSRSCSWESRSGSGCG